MIIIKIIKADDITIKNKILHLVEIKEMIWECSKTKIQIIDTWNEIELIKEWNEKENCFSFYDLHIFYQTETGLNFIQEIEYIP